MGTARRLWSTEPLWLWRSVVVAWWLVVALAVIQLVGAVVGIVAGG